MGNITFHGDSNLGQIRTNNEDSLALQKIWDDDHILAVAIDGVGGYEGGEVAAEIARDSIIKHLEKYPNGSRIELLKQAVIFANNSIYNQRRIQPQYSQMSCVLTAILIEVQKRRINMAHIGDTRLYQYADGEITKLSHDHSLVGYREEIGELTEEQAMNHPQRNVIGRDVGSNLLETTDEEYVEVATFPLKSKCNLLLCSDGLCDMVTSAQMKEVLAQNIPVEEKVKTLIDLANKAGGKDNITVLVIDSDLEELPSYAIESKAIDISEKGDNAPNQWIEETPKQKQKSKRSSLSLVVAITIALIAGYILGYYTGNNVLPFLPEENAKQQQAVAVDTIPTPTDTIASDTTLQDLTIGELKDSITTIEQIITDLKIKLENLEQDHDETN